MDRDFKKIIKERRTKDFPHTFEIVHDTFLTLKLDSKDSDYFFKNASFIVESLRNENWNTFLKYERKFSEKIYKGLIRKDIDNFRAKQAVENYIEENVDNFYTLSLSNTQSRRSRAGSEFEDIISHLFMGAGIPFDEQGLIGTGLFEDTNLAKLVDHVIPGAIEYRINKRNTLALSAKTTLRERWQQIGDEMQRTRMPEMYLATLDEKIGENTLTQLRNNNIYPVTTANIKKEKYNDNNLVLTFEELLELAKDKSSSWKVNDFSKEELDDKIKTLKKIKEEHINRHYVASYIDNQIYRLKNND